MFIHIQFDHLQHDVEQFIEKYRNGRTSHHQSHYSEFVELLNRHRELIRCVDLLEIIYSKSTLFNFVSSSLIICVTGFNIMVIKDLPLAVAFTFFFVVGIFQICIFCYYGEILIQSSSKVADAIYNSKWYECSVADMKDYLFILTRAQKPCKLTAYGFSVISLNSFAKILSKSWSYFALLLTLYKEPQTPRH
ncbi:putative odorant receptor 92a [Manduca sexta]|uniref:putative odorant receptor 92a n=1 Tax=Manduca sexta TaxID=7130 RepID=UPI0018907EA0|nr:putative odorant receptor 92a [Manduca sexta]